eukprot:COSAG06_NODE_667_length_13266_cov_25.994532_9_plen_223_part_00
MLLLAHGLSRRADEATGESASVDGDEAKTLARTQGDTRRPPLTACEKSGGREPAVNACSRPWSRAAGRALRTRRELVVVAGVVERAASAEADRALAWPSIRKCRNARLPRRGKNENGNRASEELQDCAAYPVVGQRQRPRGEAAEGKAWLAVLSFCVSWAASVGAGLGHRARWRAGSGRGRATSDASTLDSCTWAPPAGCGGERLGCGSAGTLRAAEGVDDR